jgi:hypothetical protein
VVCLASGVSPRRSDEGYEMANSSMAVMPSNPCSLRGAGGAHDEIRGGTTHTNNFPGILGAGGVPSLVDKVDDGWWMRDRSLFRGARFVILSSAGRRDYVSEASTWIRLA